MNKRTIRSIIMTITANEVKTKGVSAFDTLFEKFNEVMSDIAEGKYHTDIQKHFNTIEQALNDV